MKTGANAARSAAAISPNEVPGNDERRREKWLNELMIAGPRALGGDNSIQIETEWRKATEK